MYFTYFIQGTAERSNLQSTLPWTHNFIYYNNAQIDVKIERCFPYR